MDEKQERLDFEAWFEMISSPLDDIDAMRLAFEAGAELSAQGAPTDLCESICAAIKAAVDKSTNEAEYMIDSYECIAIVREQFAAAPVPEAKVVPAGFALVPLRMTQAMREITESEDWQWEDLLAAAEAIDEPTYNRIAADPAAPAAPAPEAEPSGPTQPWGAVKDMLVATPTKAQEADAVEKEREALRTAQTEAVMPMIGPLLDAWENIPCDELDLELAKWLSNINRAMEHAETLPAQAQQAEVKPLTDEQVQAAATDAVKHGRLSWLGFKKDELGTYSIPVLSHSDFQFARAVERACAEAWGVKLAGIGASSGENGNG